MTANQRATRAGFTLLELLMVIAIIAVLAALLLTAVSRVRKTAQVMTAASDISQMEIALGAFKQTFNVLPPSHITITTGSSDPGRTTAGVYRFRMPLQTNEPEFALLQRMFPRWSPAAGPSQGGDATTWSNAPFRFKDDATGTLDLAQMKTALGGQASPPAAPYAALVELTNPKAAAPGITAVPLDGNQVLVLFLGGPASALTTATFSSLATYGTGWDVASPTAPLATSNSKKGPHYDIPPAKLASVAGELVPHLVDSWGTPYAYFAASAGANYDPKVPFPWPAASDTTPPTTYDGNQATNFGADPSQATTFTAHAYGSGGKWMKPGEYQLISAGPDKLFGPGSVLQPANSPPLNTTAAPLLVHVWDAKNPQGGGVSAAFYGEGGGSTTTSTQLARGADDLCNFNAGSNLGTSNAP